MKASPFAREHFNYGSKSIGVVLWPKGHLIAGPLAKGSSYARVLADGEIDAKLGWWRAAPGGQLRIVGHRLDRSASPLRGDIPAGYGSYGFQASDVTFATTGCWEVIGNVGDSHLAFVVLVTLSEQARIHSSQ